MHQQLQYLNLPGPSQVPKVGHFRSQPVEDQVLGVERKPSTSDLTRGGWFDHSSMECKFPGCSTSNKWEFYDDMYV